MIDTVKIRLLNHSDLFIECDDGIAWELREHFSFFVPGYQFMPKFRNKIWDGKIRIFDYNRRILPAGLLYKFERFCSQRKYTIIKEETHYGLPGEKTEVDPKEIMDFIDGLNLHVKGKKIQIRDYQFDAVCTCIQDRRTLLLSPTSSGKSLIIYVLLRWYMEKFDQKFLVIVPTTALVEQMYGDFADYSSHDNSWDHTEHLHRIYSGKEKVNIEQRVFISTWQSIYKLPRTWFEQFIGIFGDEAHGFTAQSLTKSMAKARNAAYRFGTTGTLDGTQTNKLVLEGIFGRVRQVTTTKKLQDDGAVSKLDIKILQLQYPDEIRSQFEKISYQQEIAWLIRNEKRNKYIRNLALNLPGNTLILFKYVDKHGKVLYDMIKEETKDRVFFVSGDVETSDREAIRSIVENQVKSTTVASLGTFSTGTNIRNLHNLILATPAKGRIKVLQSIGRILRLSDDGNPVNLYDIFDDLSWGGKQNYALKHGLIREGIYHDEKFNVKKYEIKL